VVFGDFDEHFAGLAVLEGIRDSLVVIERGRREREGACAGKINVLGDGEKDGKRGEDELGERKFVARVAVDPEGEDENERKEKY